MEKKAVIRMVLHLFVGVFIIGFTVAGAFIIQTQHLSSYSDLFVEYRAVAVWGLLFVGLVLLILRVEAGFGFICLAIFSEGNFHDYIVSPLVIVLILSFYARHREWVWFGVQLTAGAVQSVMYLIMWSYNFYITETAGFLIGGGFFLYRGLKLAVPTARSTES